MPPTPVGRASAASASPQLPGTKEEARPSSAPWLYCSHTAASCPWLGGGQESRAQWGPQGCPLWLQEERGTLQRWTEAHCPLPWVAEQLVN